MPQATGSSQQELVALVVAGSKKNSLDQGFSIDDYAKDGDQERSDLDVVVTMILIHDPLTFLNGKL